jgi:geranylgeranyl diphosphate synthase type II
MNDLRPRIDRALQEALQAHLGPQTPPRLRQALDHALFGGGGRVRPQLTLGVARALGDPRPELANTAASSLELLHCASLVHDDLPCFDDADLRRGRPTVHRVFGEELAVLVGDGLIVLAFDVLARGALGAPDALGPLVAELALASGSRAGIIAGQAWESEPEIDLGIYHRAKTASLFVAATRMGAIAAGANPEPWSRVGALIGEAYQVADDLADAVATPEDVGKPVQQDAALQRPSAVRALGAAGALGQLDSLISEAVAAVPMCHERAAFAETLGLLGSRLCPPTLRARIVATEPARRRHVSLYTHRLPASA